MDVDQIVDSLGLPPDLSEGEADQPAKPFEYRDKYWLAYPYGSDEYAAEAVERFGTHLERWEDSNIGNAIWSAYRAYHSLDGSSLASNDPMVSIGESGEHGEFLTMRMNQYRGLVKHQVALVTANRPAWDPIARTTDSEASRQTALARNILDYVMDTRGVMLDLKTQKETEKVCASSFIALGWNERSGSAENGKPRGGPWSLVLAPWEVAHERQRHYKNTSWWIFRAYESRWDWVAKLAEADPEKAERVSKLERGASVGNAFLFDTPHETNADSDLIEVLYVYAKPSEACPGGRVSVIADSDLVLLDGPSPYGDEMPIERLCSAEFLGTSIPYGDSWSLLAPDEAYNALLSMVVTRFDAYGVPTLTIPQGSDYTAADVAGNKALEIPPGGATPAILDFLKVPGETSQIMSLLKQGMEELSGINSVTRGNPQENVNSGSFAALLQSMAIQFNSADEMAWIHLLERVGTHVINIYQRMASEEQLVGICGADEQWSVAEFKAEDLGQIQRVAVKVGNAMSKTLAGKMAIADTLLERGAIKDPREYLEVIETGNVTPLYSGPAKQLILVKSENERIMRGDVPQVSTWDNDELHIREHLCLLDTQLRDTPLAGAVMQHLQAHADSWGKKTRESPDILFMIGQPLLPAAQMAAQQAAQMGGPPAPQGDAPRMQEQPGTEAPPKGKPGPVGAPPGPQPGAMPNQPSPAKTPAGEPVV